MQETWAIHGVYPGIAWTPDRHSRSCSGPAARSGVIDVVEQAVADIPFHVDDTRQTATAVRFPVDVPSGQVRARSEPGPPDFPCAHAPMGLGIARRKAGRLPGPRPRLHQRPAQWRAAPPDEADRPLRVLPILVARRPSRSSTRPGTTNPGLAFASPASAAGVSRDRDGQSPAITSNRSSRPTAPGSSTGRRRADILRSSAWSNDPGIYWVASAGGKSTLVTRADSLPSFGKDSDRVFFVKPEGGGDQQTPAKRVLTSIKLRRLRRARARHLRGRDRVRRLARRQVAGLPRALQRLHHAVCRDGPARRNRPQDQGNPGDSRLEGRRRVSALLRRLLATLLVARGRSSFERT